jgi:hypothetical protein
VGSEKNPIEEYFEKKSSFGADLLTGAKGAFSPQHLGGQLAGGGLAVAGTGAAALGALAVHKIYDAATKTRDFKSMLEYAPDVAEMHAENPQQVNQMFSTLRTFNPDFTRDPVVASSYVRRMVQEPMGAGGIASEALQSRDKIKHPYSDAVTRAALGGGGKKQPPRQR